ncbi:MAG: glycosyltransferase family 4 protein [cyanobacterium endosymbiont of Rhopalodia musculus]|uniref:glycosyltransferase family 4 protein n=1 Tax=cyanobacterium endosymbiont of Epithemia clementina EcSB TaxID=3034674 RepID=UPI002480AB19|nr:glycosyltransferase family 4 protein [cyanobacterium endosymbiont of Epithemia clementina EcSB]WGT68160.1 glycosyltransferase family 4 protein [cyanobacterium endosymbiont of Epithemia clementina EcSB]
MVSSTFPYPPIQGKTQMRTFSLLKHLNKRHDLTLVTQFPEQIIEEDINSLRQQVENCIIFPSVNREANSSGFLNKAKQLGVFFQQGTPPRFLSHYSLKIQECLDQAIDSGEFDLLTCEGSSNEIYVRPQWREKLPTLINIHRSVWGTYKHQTKTQATESGLRNQINLPLLRRYEKQYCGKFLSVVTTSKTEQKLLKDLKLETPVTLIPNGLDLSRFPKRTVNQGGQRVVFIGAMDKPGNIDAARFFSLEVFPKLRKRYPEATLELVGIRPAPEVKELGQIPGIAVTGQVPSVIEYLHWATVCVIPIRKSTGTKIRSLQTLATGTPLVASDYGLEGLPIDGTGVPLSAMRANGVDEYVYAIGRLFEQPKLRGKLSINGRALVEKEYTWERTGERYEQLLANLTS